MVKVYVVRDPKATQQKGDWTVKLGAAKGRGSQMVSSHRQKAEAIKRGRRAGRTRSEQGATLYVQGKSGRPRKEATYGGGD